MSHLGSVRPRQIDGFFASHHANPPAPFNSEARPGLHKAVSEKHAKWCEANPNVSRAARGAAYTITYMSLRPKFPSVGELSK